MIELAILFRRAFPEGFGIKHVAHVFLHVAQKARELLVGRNPIEQDAKHHAMGQHMVLHAAKTVINFHSISPVLVGAGRMAELPGVSNGGRQGGLA